MNKTGERRTFTLGHFELVLFLWEMSQNYRQNLQFVQPPITLIIASTNCQKLLYIADNQLIVNYFTDLIVIRTIWNLLLNKKICSQNCSR